MRAVLALALVIALTTPAAAHVVVLPATSEAGGWERYSILVPTEGRSATVRVELKLPLGLEIVAIEAKPGWEATHDPFPLGAAKLKWMGGRIPPGQMMSFDFMAWNPKVARTLGWDATQWYEDGSSERWGGPGGDEHEASTTALVAPDPEKAAEHHAPGGHAHPAAAGHAAAAIPAEPAATAAGPPAAPADGGPSLAVSLALSALALSVAALVVAARARRRPAG